MNPYELLYEEITAEWYRANQCPVRIRVTRDAMRGAPVSVPMTPERARAFALIAASAPDGDVRVDADVRWLDRREIVIHPEDFAEFLSYLPADPCERAALTLHFRARSAAQATFYGVPIDWTEP